MTDGHSNEKNSASHGAAVRLMHWINAVAVLILILSGWAIYNASPLYDFTFPARLTLGSGLTGALLWHFAFMWLLAANGLGYVVYRVALGRGRPRLLPLSATGVLRELREAARMRLQHEPGVYNHVQKAMYLGVWTCLAVSVLSGLAIWKPVQLQGLNEIIGGYEGARRVHFWAMAAVVCFLFIHLFMVVLVPKTLLAIVIGLGAREKGL